MGSDHLLAEIHELNLCYLLLVQRLVNDDRDSALFRLGMDEEIADKISELPVSRLVQLARCDQLLCRFAINEPKHVAMLIEQPQHEDLSSIHIAILLGGDRRAANDRRSRERRQLADRRDEDLGPPDGKERRQVARRRNADKRNTPRRRADTDEPDSTQANGASRSGTGNR